MKKVLFLLLSLSCMQSMAASFINLSPVTGTTIGKYEKFEVGFDLSGWGTINNPFDPNEIDISAVFTDPNGNNYIVNGFWYQEFSRCNSCPDPTQDINGYWWPVHNNAPDPNYLTSIANTKPWRVRFASNVVGTWSYTIVATNSIQSMVSSTYTFDVINSNNKGYVKVGNNKRSFKFEDNTLFFPIGANEGFSYATMNYNRLRYKAVKDMILKENVTGANTIRLMGSPDEFGIEWNEDGLGIYNTRQNRASDLDEILEYAQQNNVYIQFCLFTHGEFIGEWPANPYNYSTGMHPQSFFSDVNSRDFFKRRLRYTIARWGYATSLFAYEMVNEVNQIDGYWGSNGLAYRTAIRSWHDEMISYAKSLDKNHLYTTSMAMASAEAPGLTSGERTYESPELDFLQMHYYTYDYNAASQYQYLLKRGKQNYNKPYFIAEYGPGGGDADGCNISNKSFYTQNVNTPGNNVHWSSSTHNALWVNSLSGGGGSGFSWENFVLFHPYVGGGYADFKPLSTFLANETIFQEDYKLVSNNCTGLYGTLASGPRDATHGGSPAPGVTPYCNPTWTTDAPVQPFESVPVGITTTNDGAIEIFGLKSDNKILAWAHLKSNYWYNQEHDVTSFGGLLSLYLTQ